MSMIAHENIADKEKHTENLNNSHFFCSNIIPESNTKNERIQGKKFILTVKLATVWLKLWVKVQKVEIRRATVQQFD